jgi:actin related protein 2/3 complex, subunit 2
MILLEVRSTISSLSGPHILSKQAHNVIIQNTLIEKYARWLRSVRCFLTDALTSATRPSSVDIQFVDYDGVRFHLSATSERKTIILLSMNIRCWNDLVRYGAKEILQREYGHHLKDESEPDYDVSLEIDLERMPADVGEM